MIGGGPDRLRVRAGLRALRRRGHRRRGGRPADRRRGARGRRGAHPAFADEGITVLTGARSTRSSHATTASPARRRQPVRAEQLLVAAGRHANLADIGLDAVGSTRRRRSSRPTSGCGRARSCGRSATSPARARSRTSRCTRPRSSVRDILGEDGPWADYRAVSRVTFTDPEVGSVGLTEARPARPGSTSVATADLERPPRLDPLARQPGPRQARRPTPTAACWSGPRRGGRRRRGPVDAGDRRARGGPARHAARMHFAYPTFHRAIEVALGEARRARGGMVRRCSATGARPVRNDGELGCPEPSHRRADSPG